MPSLTLDHDAYCLLFLHACKFPLKAVNGLLLGEASAEGVVVSKALPLGHSSLALSPMLETALMLADELCKQGGLQIVGYYQANEMGSDIELGPFGKRISDKIRSRCPQSATLLVLASPPSPMLHAEGIEGEPGRVRSAAFGSQLDGSSMRPTLEDLRLIAFGPDGKKDLSFAPKLAGGEATLAKLERYIANNLQQQVIHDT
ncbi:MAG: hypothetical protein SGPRY_011139 [Prymnesium sp.]